MTGRAKAPSSINRNARAAASARPLSLSIARVLFGTHFVLLLSFYCFNLCAGALFACAQFVACPAHRAAANRARPANEARARRAAPAPARRRRSAASRASRCASRPTIHNADCSQLFLFCFSTVVSSGECDAPPTER